MSADEPTPLPFERVRPSARLTPGELRAIGVLAELSEHALLALCDQVKVHDVRARATLMMARHFTHHVGFVHSGAFRIVALTAKADVVSLNALRPGDVFGACCAVLGLAPGANVRLVAEAPGEIVSAPNALVLDLLATEPRFAAAVLRAQSLALTQAQTRLFEIAGLDVRGRLIGELLRLAGPDAGAPTLPCPTHNALAAQIGASREAVTRHLAWLEKALVIRVNRGEIEVVDRARLQALYAAAAGAKPFAQLS